MFLYPTQKVLAPVRRYNYWIAPPVLGPDYLWNNPLAAFLTYDNLIIIGLLLTVGLAPRCSSAACRSAPITRVLAWVAVLTVSGGLISLLSSRYPDVSLGDLIGRSMILAFVWMLWRSEPTLDEIHLWVKAAVLGVCAVMAVGAYNFYQHFGLPRSLWALISAHFYTSAGFAQYELITWGNTTETQQVIVVVLALCMGMAVARGISWRDRLCYSAAIPLLWLNSLIAFERWAQVTLLLMIALIAVRAIRLRRTWTVIMIGVSALIGGIVVMRVAVSDPHLVAYFTGALDRSAAGGSTVGSHGDNWVAGLHLLLHKPWGVGLGMVGLQPELPAGAAHDLLIDAGLEGGILALAGYLVWMIWQVKRCFTVLLSRTDTPATDLAFSLYLSGLALITYTVFQSCPLWSNGLGIFMALWFVFPVLATALVHRQDGGVKEMLSS